MIYQLRTYVIPPGRMDDILNRFENTTMDLFKKYGFEVLGFWTVSAPEDAHELVYLLRFADQEASDRAWAAFREDPDWQETRRRTEADGPIVAEVISKDLKAVDFSPLQ